MFVSKLVFFTGKDAANSAQANQTTPPTPPSSPKTRSTGAFDAGGVCAHEGWPCIVSVQK